MPRTLLRLILIIGLASALIWAALRPMPDVMAQACTLLAVGYSESGENSSTTTTYSLCGGSIVIYETTVTFYANGSFSFSGRLVAEIPLSSLFWV